MEFVMFDVFPPVDPAPDFGFIISLVEHIPAMSVCYLICYSLVAVVHRFWPRYVLLAYFGLALAVAIVSGQR
jgi:hypothetical protein